MKVSDVISGALFLALAVFVFVYAQTLPPMPGQRYGAGAFPTLVALGLGGFSLLMIAQAWRRRAGARWVELADWARDGKTLGNFLLALALILVYVFFSERIGFIPLSIAILLILFWRQGIRLGTGAVVAVVATIAIQFAFSDMLRVPLPRGLLAGYLW
ncbi:MAG: tripartite tricarboxylate transporter TctB family protein [Candidatus Odyssella sp.]|nr:tripartite tricarboxylate transporter TctB family protein [Candidatus Odyssella sp.]